MLTGLGAAIGDAIYASAGLFEFDVLGLAWTVFSESPCVPALAITRTVRGYDVKMRHAVRGSMGAGLSLIELVEFTDWERSKWYDRFRERPDTALTISTGPNGDRFPTVGELVKHIFIAEKHHVDRLSNRPITDTDSVSSDNVERLFQFGHRSRKDLREFVEMLPPGDWDVPREFNIVNNLVSVTPRKFIVHVLMHEVRHWAQIATILRLNGLAGGFPDFLFSPVMGGGLKSRTE